MPADEVLARLVDRFSEFRSLDRISAVTVTKRTPFGRPIRWRFTGANGVEQELLADNARLAIGGMKIRSTDCRIRTDGADIVFENGRGFGHGVGLCQWGMQGLARRGWKAGAILHHYYPGCRLVRIE